MNLRELSALKLEEGCRCQAMERKHHDSYQQKNCRLIVHNLTGNRKKRPWFCEAPSARSLRHYLQTHRSWQSYRHVWLKKRKLTPFPSPLTVKLVLLLVYRNRRCADSAVSKCAFRPGTDLDFVVDCNGNIFDNNLSVLTLFGSRAGENIIAPSAVTMTEIALFSAEIFLLCAFSVRSLFFLSLRVCSFFVSGRDLYYLKNGKSSHATEEQHLEQYR